MWLDKAKIARCSTTSARLPTPRTTQISGQKGQPARKKLAPGGPGTGSVLDTSALGHVDGDIQLLELGPLVVRELALGHELVEPAQRRLERQFFDGGDELERGRCLVVTQQL